MLDSERNFQRKVRSRGTVLEIWPASAVIWNNNNNSTFILKERGFTKSYVAKYRLFTPHQ